MCENSSNHIFVTVLSSSCQPTQPLCPFLTAHRLLSPNALTVPAKVHPTSVPHHRAHFPILWQGGCDELDEGGWRSHLEDDPRPGRPREPVCLSAHIGFTMWGRVNSASSAYLHHVLPAALHGCPRLSTNEDVICMIRQWQGALAHPSACRGRRAKRQGGASVRCVHTVGAGPAECHEAVSGRQCAGV